MRPSPFHKGSGAEAKKIIASSESDSDIEVCSSFVLYK